MDRLDADTDGDRREDIDLMLSVEEKAALDKAFDVEPETMERP